VLKSLLGAGLLFFAALPATTNYQLNSYGFGSGGTANSSTSTYALEGISGEVSGQTSVTATYNIKPGFNETQQANVPKISTFDNGSGTYYNKLHFVIDSQSNPTDASYALQIKAGDATCDFTTGTINYVKSDLTVGGSLTLTDYQTYTAWGGASGSNIIGLTPNTTYCLRAKATQGKFTESAYGPSLSAATVNPSLSFSMTPSTINMGNLTAATVIDAPSTIDITFATNAANGGDVYINGKNTGLLSALRGVTIPSATGDLSSLSHGFGAKVTAAAQTSGGPFNSVSPYNGASNNVGITDTNIRKIFSTTASVVGGSGSVLLKAKSAADDPASTDYTETITMIASASY
jgi:hypothetical protein